MRSFGLIPRCFSVFVAAIALLGAGSLAQAQTLDPNAITGVYKGQFDCPTFRQHLTFTMSVVSKGSHPSYLNVPVVDLSGHVTVNFPQGTDAQSTGSFTIAGQLNPNNSFGIGPSPNKWESVAPSAHALFSLTGTFDPNSGGLAGNVFAMGCSKFTATRDQVESAKLIAENAQKSVAANTGNAPSPAKQAPPQPVTRPMPQSQPQSVPAATAPAAGNASPAPPVSPAPPTVAPQAENQQPQLRDPRVASLAPDKRDAVSFLAGQVAYTCSHADSLIPYDCSCVVDRAVAAVLDKGGPTVAYAPGGQKVIEPQMAILMPSLNVRECLSQLGIKKYIESLTSRMNITEEKQQAASQCASERFASDIKKDTASSVDAVDRLISSAAYQCRRTIR